MSEKKETKRYQERVKPRLDEIKAWARDGVIEEEIAKRLSIAYSTFREYKSQYSALSAALIPSRVYDDEVVYALHKNTLGGIVRLQKPFKVRKKFFENGKLVREEEVVVTAEEEVYIQPDSRAQMYWLNNRVPEKWSANPEEKKSANNDNKENADGVKPNELRIVVEKKVVDLTKGEEDADNQL